MYYYLNYYFLSFQKKYLSQNSTVTIVWIYIEIHLKYCIIWIKIKIFISIYIIQEFLRFHVSLYYFKEKFIHKTSTKIIRKNKNIYLYLFKNLFFLILLCIEISSRMVQKFLRVHASHQFCIYSCILLWILWNFAIVRNFLRYIFFFTPISSTRRKGSIWEPQAVNRR